MILVNFRESLGLPDDEELLGASIPDHEDPWKEGLEDQHDGAKPRAMEGGAELHQGEEGVEGEGGDVTRPVPLLAEVKLELSLQPERGRKSTSKAPRSTSKRPPYLMRLTMCWIKVSILS